MKRNTVILTLIVLAGLLLRTYAISANPVSLSWDEVSIGYNAYSILKTGLDEHGRHLPLDTFTAYGDYKPPLSIYLTVPFIKIFGLNEFAVRLPSALFGTGSVLLTFFLVIELFRIFGTGSRKNSRIPDQESYILPEIPHETMALLAALLLSISPWHINISRAGFEANIALFIVLLGILTILKARFRPALWLAAWLPFVAAIYTFNSSRYFVVLFAGVLIIFTFNELVQKRNLFFAGVLIAFIALLPIMPHLFSKEARLRFAEVNIFSDISVVKTANDRIAREDNTLIAKMINNRRIGFAKSYVNHFLDNFDTDFLFIKGDGNPKFSTQDTGQLYLVEAPFLFLGVLLLFQRNRKQAMFLLLWLFSAVIPAAVARETPHALRILNSLPTWQIFISYGILSVYFYLSEKNIKIFSITVRKSLILPRLVLLLLFCSYAFQFFYYLYNYYVHYPRIYAAEWQYGYKQAYLYADTVKDSYEHIYVTDKIGRPYMYGLFYLRYDPAVYLKEKKSYFDAAGFYHVDGFGKFNFPGDVPKEVPANSLIIGDPSWVKPNQTIRMKFEYPNGDTALVAYQ